MIYVDHHFLLRQTPKNTKKKYFTPKQTEYKLISKYQNYLQ